MIKTTDVGLVPLVEHFCMQMECILQGVKNCAREVSPANENLCYCAIDQPQQRINKQVCNVVREWSWMDLMEEYG